MTTRKLHDAAMAALQFSQWAFRLVDNPDSPVWKDIVDHHRLALKQALAALEQD